MGGNYVVIFKGCRYSNYPGRCLLLDRHRWVYLGKSQNYVGAGLYYNFDNSMLFISDNARIYPLLSYCPQWPLSQAELLRQGFFQETDLIEFLQLQKTVLSKLHPIYDVKFDGELPMSP